MSQATTRPLHWGFVPCQARASGRQAWGETFLVAALIVVGGGARMAGDAVRELAELLHAPVAMTQNALGTLDCRHELAFTQLGAHHWWSKADVVLALGTRLFPAAMAWGRDSEQKIIKVDIDAAELNRLPAPIDGIHGDVAEAAIALVLFVGFAAGILPALAAQRLQVADALRR